MVFKKRQKSAFSGKKHSEKSKELMKKPKSKKHKENLIKNHADVSGDKNPNWKGGKKKDNNGYILIHSPNHPNKNVRNYVLEHRLVMEKHLRRYLKPSEIVHHIDRNPSNNKINNLKLFLSNKAHTLFHHKLKKREK